MTQEEKARRYDEAIEISKKWRNAPNVNKIPTFANRVIEEIFPELKESEDERIREKLIDTFNFYDPAMNSPFLLGIHKKDILAWFEKQGIPSKLSEEEQHKFAKGVLTSCALSFIGYLDAHRYEGKMCVSNGVCEGIKNAFHNAMWDRLHRYYCKYIEKQGEQKHMKNIVETWKEMRLEVYAQASGNRHEPNYSDDTTKMFSLNDIDEIIEKISEQKPTDKVETKFKVRDWIANGGANPCYVKSIFGDYYELCSCEGFEYTKHIKDVDYIYRLWTIQDAKDGDVLNDENSIFIFKDLLSDNSVVTYCDYDTDCGESDAFCSLPMDLMCSKITPATKEQRDLLFQKIEEAGYMWDANKKELKKIEQKSTDKDETKFHRGQWIVWQEKCYKVNYNGCGYELVDQNGLSTSLEYGTVDKNAHIWDITKDARVGDVLASKDKSNILIFRNLDTSTSFSSYYNTAGKGELGWSNECFIPATKEQRNQLEKAMVNAGYTFDFEKKEPKKIEQKPTDKDEPKEDNRPVTERIKTFKDACDALGDEHPFVTQYRLTAAAYKGDPMTEDFIAYLKLRIIVAALNEGWEPKFDKGEYRYYPWFYLYTKEQYDKLDDEEKGRCVLRSGCNSNAYCGFVSVYAYNDASDSYTNFGSRLVFRTRELAEYAGRQFLDEWADFVFKTE